ncbi:MAG: helix-turn-helix transcriptional regulator [Pseudomonadota bacterium]
MDDQQIKREIGNRIRQARKAAGMTQTELAVACGWESTQSRISNYETGSRDVTATDLIALEDALGIHPGALLGARPPQDGSDNKARARDLILSMPSEVALQSFIDAIPKFDETTRMRVARLCLGE